jgi:hypothetical protein
MKFYITAQVTIPDGCYDANDPLEHEWYMDLLRNRDLAIIDKSIDRKHRRVGRLQILNIKEVVR